MKKSDKEKKDYLGQKEGRVDDKDDIPYMA